MKRSLASRMLVLAIAQMTILAIAALVIWWFTAPHLDPHPHAGPPGPPPQFALGPLLTLLVGFVVLAIGAVLTARWLVRPIEELSKTASALGEGDLATRSGIVRDDELGELGRRIDQMGEKIEQILKHERELLANVAHELRTPLARIGVALDLANEGSSDRARSSLAEIGVDVAELEVIVDDVLTALRYDVTRGASMPLRKSLVQPAMIITASAERMRGRHPARPLEISIADDLPDIDVDAVLFRRVIDNLLDNAHKYTPEKTSAIQLAAHRAGVNVEIAVIDRGIGIATAEIPNIYNAFYRTDLSRSREAGGVGLGLTLTKRIVEAHGGTITITSGTDKGTRATVAVAGARV